MSYLPHTDESFLASEDAGRWRDTLSRISVHAPANLDDILGPADPQFADEPGIVHHPRTTEAT